MKLYSIEYQEWNDGAPGGQWFWCGQVWATDEAEALRKAASTYKNRGKSYRAY